MTEKSTFSTSVRPNGRTWGNAALRVFIPGAPGRGLTVRPEQVEWVEVTVQAIVTKGV